MGEKWVEASRKQAVGVKVGGKQGKSEGSISDGREGEQEGRKEKGGGERGSAFLGDSAR